MFKKWTLLLILLLAFALVACGGDDAAEEEPAEETPAEEAEAPAEEAEEPMEEEAPAEKVTLTIESWRNDDLAIWQDVIIPAFNEEYPDIEVVFAPTAPAEYDGVLNVKLEGGTAGDLYLRIQVSPHPAFRRDKDDLLVTIPVDLYTAVLGGKTTVSSVDRSIQLTIPPETANGKIFRLRGLGMPNLHHPDRRGDLYVTVEVQIPQGLSQKEKVLFGQLREMKQAVHR